MLHELRKVIPSFLRRVDLPDRGGRWTTYFATTRQRTAEVVESLFAERAGDHRREVTLVDFDPDAEDKLLAAICYPHSNLSEHQLLDRVAQHERSERSVILRDYVGDRSNRRHRPGRTFERSGYRFDVLSDYGAFRDIQRHRMLTIEWQRLRPYHGVSRPALIDEAGAFSGLSTTRWIVPPRCTTTSSVNFPSKRRTRCGMAYRLRYVMQFNAREAIHMLELRSSPRATRPIAGSRWRCTA